MRNVYEDEDLMEKRKEDFMNSDSSILVHLIFRLFLFEIIH